MSVTFSSAKRGLCAGLVAVGSLAAADVRADLPAGAPAWWIERGAVDTNCAANDYAAANLGQAKHMAALAGAELEARLAGGAGEEVLALVAGLTPTNNYFPLNLGQLKALARPFHARLIAAGRASAYPWTDGTGDDADYAAANLGQLKRAFAFDLSGPADADGDGLADEWELEWIGGLGADGAADTDGDGLVNSNEYRRGTSPLLADSDGDGVADGLDAHPGLAEDADGDGLADDWEALWFGSAAHTPGDADGDGRDDARERHEGTDPTRADVPGSPFVRLGVFTPPAAPGRDGSGE